MRCVLVRIRSTVHRQFRVPGVRRRHLRCPHVQRHVDAVGFDEYCEECAAGHFAESEGLSSCAQCSSGSVAPFTGSSACLECAAGTFAVHSFNDVTMQWDIMDSCEECAPGYFANDTGSTDCAVCSSGSVAPFTGSSACQECAAGTFAVHSFNDEIMQWDLMHYCEECAPWTLRRRQWIECLRTVLLGIRRPFCRQLLMPGVLHRELRSSLF